MEVLEEENPLRIEREIEPSTKVAKGFRNNVGRPARKNEILFSAPPKSMISLLLRNEKDKKLKEDQDQQLEISINQNKNGNEESKKIKEAPYHKLASISPNRQLKEISSEPVKKWTCEHCLDR